MGLLTWVLLLSVITAMLAARYHDAGLSVAHLCALVSICLLVALLLYRRYSSFGWHPGWRSSTEAVGSTRMKVAARQLNESLWELYRPQGTPKIQILFFHGFQLGAGDYDDAHISTWKCGDNTGIWPQTWLAEKFPQAHILSVSYNARVKKSFTHGNVRLFILGENLLSDLLQEKVGQEPHCPVILVGHSFGGLVMKELCVQASDPTAISSQDSANKFLANVKGIFFYATPHRGIRLVEGAGLFINSKSPLWEYVKTLSTSAAILNQRFDNLCKKYDTWQIAGLGENLPIKWFNALVVPEGSSRVGTSFNIVKDADHFSICWPMRKSSRSFMTFIGFVEKIATGAKVEEVPGNFQHSGKRIIGVDHFVQEVKMKLDEVTRLGLVGMGGVGKTTLAMEIFNAHERHFEYTCFIREVKNVQGTVEDAVLAGLHRFGNKIELKDGLRPLRGKELFLVLDDVASGEHLQIVSILLGDGIMVHEKSRFIATSRDSQLLRSNDYEVYPVQRLNDPVSEQVFLSYAFPREAPPPHLVEYIHEVVRKCGGLPLTLEVIGKYLKVSGDSKEIWEETLLALDRADEVAGFDENLWAKLKLSYDGLAEVEKEMFLDAAEVLKDVPVCEAKRFWHVSARGLTNMHWKRLVDLSLVWEHQKYVGEGEIVGMHEQLTSLAKKISQTHGRRIWNNEEHAELLEVLSTENWKEDDVKDIVALKLENSASDASGLAKFRGAHLYKMKRLRYLTLADLQFRPPLDASLPLSLVWLSCYLVNFTNLPINPNLHKHLVRLELKDCDGIFTLPDNFGSLRSLEVLKLYSETLKSLPDSLGDLPKLQKLEIAGRWKKLPETLGNLNALIFLKICDSPNLEELPRTLGNLIALENFAIWDCNRLSSLPKSLEHLSNLREFSLLSCEGVQELPASFLRLQLLEKVFVEFTRLQSVPDIALLQNLKIVVLRWASGANFPTLPPCLGKLITKSNYDRHTTFIAVVDGQFEDISPDSGARMDRGARIDRADYISYSNFHQIGN
ncbi:unnamed protein product [Calypogeia fissa]